MASDRERQLKRAIKRERQEAYTMAVELVAHYRKEVERDPEDADEVLNWLAEMLIEECDKVAHENMYGVMKWAIGQVLANEKT